MASNNPWAPQDVFSTEDAFRLATYKRQLDQDQAESAIRQKTLELNQAQHEAATAEHLRGEQAKFRMTELPRLAAMDPEIAMQEGNKLGHKWRSWRPSLHVPGGVDFIGVDGTVDHSYTPDAGIHALSTVLADRQAARLRAAGMADVTPGRDAVRQQSSLEGTGPAPMAGAPGPAGPSPATLLRELPGAAGGGPPPSALDAILANRSIERGARMGPDDPADPGARATRSNVWPDVPGTSIPDDRTAVPGFDAEQRAATPLQSLMLGYRPGEGERVSAEVAQAQAREQQLNAMRDPAQRYAGKSAREVALLTGHTNAQIEGNDDKDIPDLYLKRMGLDNAMARARRHGGGPAGPSKADVAAYKVALDNLDKLDREEAGVKRTYQVNSQGQLVPTESVSTKILSAEDKARNKQRRENSEAVVQEYHRKAGLPYSPRDPIVVEPPQRIGKAVVAREAALVAAGEKTNEEIAANKGLHPEDARLIKAEAAKLKAAERQKKVRSVEDIAARDRYLEAAGTVPPARNTFTGFGGGSAPDATETSLQFGRSGNKVLDSIPRSYFRRRGIESKF